MPNNVHPSCLAVRALRPGDLPALLRIQLACYETCFIESGEVYARRLDSSTNCSLVVERDGELGAYLAAYRSSLGKVTPLHGDFGCPTGLPDTLYLHDMAVLPAHAGQGMARALLERMWAQGREEGLRHSALVSVQGTRDYWARQGYTAQPLSDTNERLRLASYGEEAVYMTCAL